MSKNRPVKMKKVYQKSNPAKNEVLSASNDSILTGYLREIANYPSLSSSEEKKIAKLAKKGDAEAKKKLIQATCLFFVMMLIFTILSRVSDSVNVIQIQTKNPANQMITHEVKGSGKVEGSQEVAVFVLENLQVEQVMVHAGQTVKKGDILLKLSQNSIQAALKNLDDKVKTLEGQAKDLES